MEKDFLVGSESRWMCLKRLRTGGSLSWLALLVALLVIGAGGFVLLKSHGGTDERRTRTSEPAEAFDDHLAYEVDGHLVYEMRPEDPIDDPASDREVRSIAFSPDGSVVAAAVASGDRGELQLWDPSFDTARRHDHIATFPESSPVTEVAFSPSGDLLAAGTEAGTVVLWDTETWEPVTSLSPDGHSVSAMDFLPNGDLLALGTTGTESVEVGVDSEGNPLSQSEPRGSIGLWDVETEQHVATLIENEQVFDVTFSPDGDTLAAAVGRVFIRGDHPNPETVRLWDIHTLEQVGGWRSEDEQPGEVVNLAYSPDGRQLAGGRMGEAVVWDPDDGDVIGQFAPWSNMQGNTENYVNAVAFSPDGDILAGGATIDNFAVVPCWEVDSSADPFGCYTTDYGTNDEALAVAFSPDSRYLASGHDDGKVWVYTEDE